DLRRLFAKPNVRTALLVEGAALVATVDQDDVPDTAADVEPALSFARCDAERVAPEVPVRDVVDLLERTRQGRIVVVAEDGTTLLGLLCLSGVDDAFCSGGE